MQSTPSLETAKSPSIAQAPGIALLVATVLAVSAVPAIPATQGDFGGDLRADILWRNEQAGGAGANYIYPMNGTTILPTEGLVREVPDQNWKVAAVADFDGDGKADILWRHSTTGANYLFPMDGTNVKATEGFVRSVAQDWKIAGVGDFDGDGKADILWRNSTTGENYIFPMDGTNVKATEGYIRTVADQNWKIAGIGDFDGDGKADILWRHASTGENYIYPMDGTSVKPTEGYTRTVIDQNWRVVAIGDYTGDGKADILWRNSASGENYIYPMNGTSVLPAEGYLRTVADLNWKVQPAAAITSAVCPSVSSAAITLPAAASIPSRVSGVAPLAVFFDATATTATTTSRPFHEIEFAWDFGDGGSGNWGPTGLSRNLATGAVAAHVYEKPGTFDVCLTAFDGTNISTRTLTITVTDPDTVFAGENTICVRQSATGTFAGCPAGARQETQANFVTAMSTFATAGKRVLFRRGDTWTPNAIGFLNPNSGVAGIIGAFGNGARPRIASVLAGNADTILSIGSANFSDWRIMDLELDGQNASNLTGITFNGGANKVTMLRLHIHDTDIGGIMLSEFSSDILGQIWKEIAVVDSTITNTSYSAYFAAEKAAWLGNTLTNNQASAGVGIFRTQYFTKSVMSNNLMSGSPPGFHVLKFGAPRWAASDGGLPLYMGKYSELSVISDNIFDDRTGTTGWMMTFGPENGFTEERVRDIIIERNWSRSGVNNDNHYLIFNCVSITFRNNLVDMTGGTNVDANGVAIADRGGDLVFKPDTIHVYNNTFYRGDAANGPLRFINLFAGTNIVLRNNLASAPLVSSKTMVNDSATGTVSSNNLLTNTPGFVGPLTSPPGFKLNGTGAGTVDTGAAVPVFSDFFRQVRPKGAARDLGAAEF